MFQTTSQYIKWGRLKTPISIKWCFHALSLFFPLMVCPSAGFTPSWNNIIVFSLWDITLQPPASHLFFGEKLASAKLAASNMSHKQYIMYMYERRYRFFSSYRFFEWELHIANGGSWHTKRIGAGLLYSPKWISGIVFSCFIITSLWSCVIFSGFDPRSEDWWFQTKG